MTANLSKLVVTFFANSRSLYDQHNKPQIPLSSACELAFTEVLTSLLSPAPITLDASRPLSPRVFQSTYLIPFDSVSADWRHQTLIARFEEKYSLEIVLDLLPSLGLSHRPIRLAIFDMDSTLIDEEDNDQLARSIGVTAAVSSITAQAMEGKIDFEQSLRARLALLEGVNTDVWEKLRKTLTIAAGARELCQELRRRGIILAVASGGFAPMAEWLKDQLGLDYAFANHVRYYVPFRRFFLPYFTYLTNSFQKSLASHLPTNAITPA